MSNWINWRIAIVRSKELSSGAKGMGLYLNTFMNDRHDFAWPSIETICGEMNLSNKTAIKYLNELEVNNLLVKEKRYGKSTKYHAKISTTVESTLLEELHRRSVESTPTVVEDLHSNKQKNKQMNKQGALARPDGDKSPKQKTDQQSNTKPPSRKPANDVSRETVAYAASHKPFEDPPAMTAEDKAAAQAQLDAMTKKINGRDSQAINKINKCRFPNRLVTLCKHLGLGEPPAGMDFDEAKTWALRKVQQ